LLTFVQLLYLRLCAQSKTIVLETFVLVKIVSGSMIFKAIVIAAYAR